MEKRKPGRPTKYIINDELIQKIRSLYEKEYKNASDIFKILNGEIDYPNILKIIKNYKFDMKVPKGFKHVVDHYYVNKEGDIFIKGKGIASRNSSDDGRYVSTTMCLKDGTRRCRDLHRVVYETFKGEVPEGYVVHHIDDNPKNNKLNNLKLITHRENILIGMRKTDRKKWSKRLTESEKTTIKELYEKGMSYLKISKLMGVSRITVENVLNNYKRSNEYNKLRLERDNNNV